MHDPIHLDHPIESVDKFTTDYTDRLLSLLTTKLELVESLHTLSVSQAAITPGEDVSTLLRVIARRESLLDQLLLVQDQLQIYQADDPDQRTWSSPVHRDSCRQVKARIETLMKSILHLDAQTLETMCQQRDIIAAELQHGMDSNLVERAYASNESLQQSVLDVNDL